MYDRDPSWPITLLLGLGVMAVMVVTILGHYFIQDPDHEDEPGRLLPTVHPKWK